MENLIISHKLSKHILMTGVYYKKHHPGGISAVVQYWSSHIDGLQYYPTFKEGNNIAKMWWFMTSVVRLFFRMLLDEKVKIIHIHTAADRDFWRSEKIIILAKFLKKRILLHSHASRFKDFYSEASDKKKQWILSTLNKVDVLIVLSESWKEWFESIGVENKKITILHNITAYPLQLNSENKKNLLPVHFLFMGEIGQRKGIFDIIRAITKHKDKLKGKIQLRIGGNKQEERLLSTIKTGGIEDMVFFEGFVSGDKKIKLFNWADVYILPSFNEGLPISILEAMSYSMPIITTPVGGIPELVDETNGKLIEPGNSEEIYTSMKFYIEHLSEIKNQGACSYHKVESYLPDYVLNHLKSIYESLLK